MFSLFFFRTSLVTQLLKNLLAMQDTQVLFQSHKETLEIIMAAHSSNLAWGTPWTEDSDRL